MRVSTKPNAQLIILKFKEYNIKNIIISPGSRSAPLTLSFINDPFFICFSIVDERCAAFFALGLAQKIQSPCVLVCTSGSALLNYYPAVSEAFYSNIPLIVLSADRPPQKIDIGDGQTINQPNIYGKHVIKSLNLFQDPNVRTTEKLIQQYEGRKSNKIETEVGNINKKKLQSILKICIIRERPIHINVPFEEPLYEMINSNPVKLSHRTNTIKKSHTLKDISRFINLWSNSSKKLILVGVCRKDIKLNKLLTSLSKDDSVVVLTESTSNLQNNRFFKSIDSIIAPIELLENSEELLEKIRPEILLTFGDHIVSKKIKVFLRSYSPDYHWHTDPYNWNDTFHCLTSKIKVPIVEFIEELLPNVLSKDSQYYSNWDKLKKNYKIGQKEYLKKITFSDFMVHEIILKCIPKKYQLHLANSSIVRYAQLFFYHDSIITYSNRGTSGIDGSLSTAIGSSIYAKQSTLIIIGDLSFLYDSNALWNNYIRSDFRIIVVNNKGGGIFRILPGNDNSSTYERFFETTHSLSATHLCKMFDIDYGSANGTDQLHNELKHFFVPSKKPKLLEIFTPRKINDKILMNYFKFIAQSI